MENLIYIFTQNTIHIHFLFDLLFTQNKKKLPSNKIKKSLNIDLDPSFLRPFFVKGARELSFFSHS